MAHIGPETAFLAHRMQQRESCITSLISKKKERSKMKNPLDSLWGTVISGLVLTVVLYVIVNAALNGV